ncbi:MAG TPA: YecA family protein [Gammaproteobacteria bacterium]|nr:YecA family protein [Gammaproteobacteria bacterium]
MNYEQIDDALMSLHAGMDSAECHGVLCGLLAVQEDNAQSRWLAHCAPGVEAGDLLAQEAVGILQSVYIRVLEQMKNPDFVFQLLLPDDDSGLPERIDAFSHWCQGFLMGMSLGGVVDTAKLPGELPEFVRDLLAFTHAGDFETDDVQDEQSWSELNEYVRMGVLLFHEEIRSLKETANSKARH